MDFDFNDIGSTLIDEEAAIEVTHFSEGYQLMQEGINLTNIANTAIKVAKVTKENIQKMWRWFVRAAKYIWSSIKRRYKSAKVEKKLKDAEKVLEQTGSAVIDFDDIPGDIYEDEYEENVNFVSLAEAAGSELTVFADVTVGDIAKFAKNVILNKGFVIKGMALLTPGVGTVTAGVFAVKHAAQIAKTIAVLTPIVTDFIVTSKEIALLRKKYAGKMKRIRDENGNVYIEMPAETHITIDKYAKLCQRIIEFLAQGGRKETVTVKIRNTDDLIKAGKCLTDNAGVFTDDLEKRHYDRMDKAWQDIKNKYDDLWATCTDISKQQELQTQEANEWAAWSRGNSENSMMTSMTMDVFSTWGIQNMLSMVINSANMAMSFYVDGEEYRIANANEVKSAVSDDMLGPIIPYISQIVNFSVKLVNEVEEMNLAGSNCLDMFVKIMGKVLLSTVGFGKNLAADIIKKGGAAPNRHNDISMDKFLVKAHSESMWLEAGRRGTGEKVRDGYLEDLPEAVRTKVMNIHKVIKSTVDNLLDDPNYEDLKDSSWAMSCIDEFCAMPKDKSDIGSVRVYKKGRNYRCMIQATGHFRNHQYGWIEGLLHDFIGNVFSTIRPQIRKKFDITITNEGRTGNPFEGFDIFTSAKVAKEIWELFDDKKMKNITESSEEEGKSDPDDVINESVDKTSITCGFRQLPKGLSSLVNETNNQIVSLFKTMVEEDQFKALKDDAGSLNAALNCLSGKSIPGAIGSTTIDISPNGAYNGEVTVTPEPDESMQDKLYPPLLQAIEKKMAKKFKAENPGKRLILTGRESRKYFAIILENDYSQRLYKAIKTGKSHKMTEATAIPEYNVNMTEAQAKSTLRTCSKELIDGFAQDKNKKMTQYTANIYANIITKNLLSKWASGYSRLIITLDDYQSFPTVEFKIPKMTADFVGRFIEGRESMDGFLHRQPEIRIKMSPRVFHTMKDPDDAYNFFKAAIMYYDRKISKAAQRLMAEAKRLTPGMRHLVSTTKLSGIVTYPMQLLFVFDDVDMTNKDTFTLSDSDVKAVSSFIRNIASHYAAPEKEKSKIIDDVKSMVKALRESCSNDNISVPYSLAEEVSKLYDGDYDKIIQEYVNKWHEEQVDHDAMKAWNNDLQYMREAFGVKKLKKIPLDTVAYIQIETECIKDANDKMMISSYCLSKIEIVEWYIELLEVGSKKYIVPHNKPYLQSLRTQLLACFKKIMSTPIPKSTDRPLIDIQYPKGYEG